MKDLLSISLIILISITMQAQEMDCSNITDIIEVDAKSWNQNKEVQDANLYTSDYRFYEGDRLLFTGFENRIDFINKTHQEIENFKLEILDYSCTTKHVVTYWMITGFHKQFQVNLKTYGILITKVRDGQAYEAIQVFDNLPSLLAGGYQLVPSNADK